MRDVSCFKKNRCSQYSYLLKLPHPLTCIKLLFHFNLRKKKDNFVVQNVFVLLQAAVKSKKATDTYKLYVEKYALAKADFEQKMTETAQVGIFKALNLR